MRTSSISPLLRSIAISDSQIIPSISTSLSKLGLVVPIDYSHFDSFLLGSLNDDCRNQLFEVANSALLEFVKINYFDSLSDDVTLCYSTEIDEVVSKFFHNVLNVDSELLYALVKRKDLIVFAGHVLSYLVGSVPNPTPIEKWGFVRFCIVVQSICESLQISLFNLAQTHVEYLQTNLHDLPEELRPLIALELAGFYLTYLEVTKSGVLLERAEKLCGLVVDFTGSMGKRTKFQQHEVAQLVLKRCAEHDPLVYGVPSLSNNVHLPVNVPLDDETVLEHAKYVSNDDSEYVEGDLTPLHQCLLLCRMLHRKRCTSSVDELVNEELILYLREILNYPQSYAVQYSALYLRSVLERQNRRRVERSLTQLRELVEDFNKQSKNDDTTFCMTLLTIGAFLPTWEVKKTMAELLESLGCVREALESFQQLNMYDSVIRCYRMLDRLPQAEALIREHLAEKETPYLYCLLGDVIQQPEPYLKAWELSGGRNARSQTGLGRLYFKRQQYTLAIKSLEVSLEIQPLQIEPWFTLGYCAMHEKQYQVAVKAYRRAVNIEPDHFEAWNNLSAALIHLGQKEKAFQLLQEALKYQFDSWKIWENLLLCAIDTRQFREAIQAANRLIDLKNDEKWVDVEVLKILALEISESQSNGDSGNANLKPDLLKLFGRLTSKVTTNSDVWRWYAVLCEPSQDCNDLEEWDKSLRFYLKSYQCAQSKQNWESDEKQSIIVIESAKLLAEKHELVVGLCGNKPQSLVSAKLSLKSSVAKIKKLYDGVDNISNETVKSDVICIEEMLSKWA